jgi:hypothetical protein
MSTTINLGSIEINLIYIIILIETIVIFITIYKIKKEAENIRILKENNGTLVKDINILQETNKILEENNKSLNENIKSLKENIAALKTNTAVSEENTKYQKINKREELYELLSQTTYNARFYVHQLSVSQSGSNIHNDEEKKLADKFLESLKIAKFEHNLNDIKILGPTMEQKIGGLYERQKYGAEVKVLHTITVFDIRIHIVDDEIVVIGFSPCGDKCEIGYIIRSSDLAKILNSEFMRYWNSTESVQLIDYIGNEIIFKNRCIMSKERFDLLIENVLYISDGEDKKEILEALTKGGYLKVLDNKVINYYKLVDTIPKDQKDLSIEAIKNKCGEAGEILTDSDANLIMSLFCREESVCSTLAKNQE